MSTKKNLAPIRRLPSRNGRADFDTNSYGRGTAPQPPTSSNNPARNGTISGDVQAVASSSSLMETNMPHDSGIREDRTTSMNQSKKTTSRNHHKQKQQQQRQQLASNSSSDGSGIVTPGRLPAPSPTPSATSARRGRGRPRKKSIDDTMSHVPADSPDFVTAHSAGPTLVEPAIPGATAAVASNDQEVQRNQRSRGAGSGQGKRGSASETHAADNDSDEWSDDDEVHHLPDEIKAQFGNIVWAKCRGNPPWPAQVWDPRFLGSASLKVSQVAYNSLGHSHLVKFYDTKGSFAAVPYKSISLFDPVELPKHLKSCKNAKKKELLKDDVQVATEDARRSRIERLTVMHEMGRSSAPPKTSKSKKPSTSQPAAAGTVISTDSTFSAAAESSTSSVATPGSLSGASSASMGRRGRGRGRPRKYPIKELEADRPSSSSSGAEYELELPKEAEDAAMEGVDEAVEAVGVRGGGQGEEEEEEDEVMGVDGDEEEYTAEPEHDDEDDKIFEESYASSKKSSRKRGRTRKSGGRGRDDGDGGGSASGGGGGRRQSSVQGGDDAPDLAGTAQKRPRLASASFSSRAGDRSPVDSGSAPTTRKKVRQRATGEGKANALAVIRAFFAKHPPAVYGRDEGWISTKEEAREARERTARKSYEARESPREAHESRHEAHESPREAHESPCEAKEEREARESSCTSHEAPEVRDPPRENDEESEARDPPREDDEEREAIESPREDDEEREAIESPREDDEERESPREANETRDAGESSRETPHEIDEAPGAASAEDAGASAQGSPPPSPPKAIEVASGGVKRDRAAGGKVEDQPRGKKQKKSKSALRDEKQKQQASKKRQHQLKNPPPQPVGKQRRREVDKAKGSGKSDDGGAVGDSKVDTATSRTGAGKRENQIHTALKLTQKLGKASVEDKFSKDDVLEVLRRLGELEESVELLQQSGCGKAVANTRKYFFGGQVKHNDKDVATAASALRSRWAATLGKGTPAHGSALASVDGKRTNAGESSRSHHGGPKVEVSAAGAETARASAGERRGVKHVEKNGGRKGKKAKGSGEHEEGKSGMKSEVVVDVPFPSSVPGDALTEAVKEASRSAALDEPRRRALGMLTSVLGSAAPAMKRCTAIEEELFSSQGQEVGKEYLRCLRTAVFSMEGSGAQRLRDKVMSEMVLPRDFTSKSSDELRALAGMV